MTARARAFASFGAYLCLLTHLTGLLHVLVVRHATCPDHGELIHGRAPVVAQAPQALDAVVTEAPADAAEEADEHCLFVATRRREMAGLAAAPLAAAVAVAPSVAPPLPLLPDVRAPRALLRLAPKTSPPLAAV
jgi:hypothetical protein